MGNKLYYTPMKDHIENWIGVVTGLGGGGFTVTMLSVNLQTVEGIVYFLLSAFFAGLVGFLAKKVGELFWNKLTKPKKDEGIYQIDSTRERDGDFE